MSAGQAQTRTILSLGNALEVKGTFVTAAATGTTNADLPAKTISGDFLIQQNGGQDEGLPEEHHRYQWQGLDGQARCGG